MSIANEPKRYLGIINPISGMSRKYRIPAMLADAFSGDDERIIFAFTKKEGDAAMLAREAIKDAYEGVIAVGGDGTINEIAGALYNSNVKLGIIPKGSGNGLARALGIPLDSESTAIDIIRQGHAMAIDASFANGIPFFCTFGVGFDAAVTQRYAQAATRGLSSYIWSVLDEYRSFKPKQYRITANKKTFEREAMIVTCANIDQYGNNAFIAPGASPNDGLLDLVIVAPVEGFQAAQVAIQLFTKTVDKNTRIESLRSAEIKIEREEEGIAQIDGESIVLGKEINISVIPRSLLIYTPSSEQASPLPSEPSSEALAKG